MTMHKNATLKNIHVEVMIEQSRFHGETPQCIEMQTHPLFPQLNLR